MTHLDTRFRRAEGAWDGWIDLEDDAPHGPPGSGIAVAALLGALFWVVLGSWFLADAAYDAMTDHNAARLCATACAFNLEDLE